MEIGILVHGRHVEAIGWEKLVWGEPPYKLGSVPTMVRVVLDKMLGGVDVRAIVFGTGASEKDGLKEAEYTKRFLMENIERLREFSPIANHPCYKSAYDFRYLKDHLSGIICETKSQNTDEEVVNAAVIFSDYDVDEVVQISCSSHLPRCLVCQCKAREAGKIPPEQPWYAIPDGVTFGGVPVGKSVVILEAPHRGDDPMVKAALKPHEVIPGLFGLAVQERVEVLDAMKRHMERIKKIKSA